MAEPSVKLWGGHSSVGNQVRRASAYGCHAEQTPTPQGKADKTMAQSLGEPLKKVEDGTTQHVTVWFFWKSCHVNPVIACVLWDFLRRKCRHTAGKRHDPSGMG